MRIYTTYFAKLKSLPEGVIPISICGKAPSWYIGAQYKKLAPKYEFFREWQKTHDNNYYIKCFKEQVTSLLIQNIVVSELSKISSGCDIALVCYEKPTDFCHRHLVAEWLNEYGYDVQELSYAKV